MNLWVVPYRWAHGEFRFTFLTQADADRFRERMGIR